MRMRLWREIPGKRGGDDSADNSGCSDGTGRLVEIGWDLWRCNGKRREPLEERSASSVCALHAERARGMPPCILICIAV